MPWLFHGASSTKSWSKAILSPCIGLGVPFVVAVQLGLWKSRIGQPSIFNRTVFSVVAVHLGLRHAFPRFARPGSERGLSQFHRTQQRGKEREGFGPVLSRCPSSALSHPFLGEGSPSKIDYRKKSTLILTSLLEELVVSNLHEKGRLTKRVWRGRERKGITRGCFSQKRTRSKPRYVGGSGVLRSVWSNMDGTGFEVVLIIYRLLEKHKHASKAFVHFLGCRAILLTKPEVRFVLESPNGPRCSDQHCETGKFTGVPLNVLSGRILDQSSWQWHSTQQFFACRGYIPCTYRQEWRGWVGVRVRLED